MSAKISTGWYLRKAYSMKLASKQKTHLFTRHEDTCCTCVHYKYIMNILMHMVQVN